MTLGEGLNRILKSGESKDVQCEPLAIEEISASNGSLVEAVFDLAQIALWEWHIPEDRILGTRQMYDMLGIQAGDYGSSLQAIIEAVVHPDYLDYVQMVLKDTLKKGYVDRFKFRIVRKDGRESWLMVKAMIRSDGKTAVGIVMDCSQSQLSELSLHRDLTFIQNLVDTMPNPVFCKDAEGIYRFCNLAFAEMIGTHMGNIIGKTVYDVSSPENAACYRQKDNELIASGGTQEYESNVETRTGEERVYRFHKAACYDHQGAVNGLVGVMTDITGYADTIIRGRRLTLLKEAMLEVSHSILGLQDTKALLQLLLDKALSAIPSSHAGSVLLIDEAGYLQMLVCRGYNSEGAKTFKLKIEETFTYRISGGRFEEPFIVNNILGLVADGCLEPLETLDGRLIASNLSTPIMVEGDPIALMIVDSFDNNVFTEDDVELMSYLKVQAELALTNLKLYQDTLRLSRYDHLTGVLNRGYFDSLLAGFVEQSQPFTFAMMDLDGLKIVNDRQGHREGDFRLQAFSKRIRTLLSAEDIVGRYGGDEFVAVFFDREQAAVVRLLTGLMETLSQDTAVYCSFSFGTARYPEEGSTHEELVRTADRKLYDHKRAKNFGRRREDHGNQNQ